jgi:HD-GYP domain-containing protein (c-di-GMP phosphodiesterase class II)
MAINSKKINVNLLVKGMYVSKLDRPWIDTPYSIEGFYIQNEQDITQLTRFCQHIFIDVDLTRLRINRKDLDITFNAESSSRANITSIDSIAIDQNTPPREKVTLKRKTLYLRQTPFDKELKIANKLYEILTTTASQLLKEVAAGESIDIESIHDVATSMVSSIIRNPDTFLWLSRLKAKDTHSHNRSIRATIWAITFGRYLGLEKAELNDLSVAVLLSNIGKAKLPRELLEKEELLKGDELKQYQTHIDISIELLQELGIISPKVTSIVAAHCERYDGSGYPLKLKKNKINFLAQIAGIVDYYEKVTNRRTAKKSLDATRAMEHLYSLRDSKFQAELIEEFIQSIGIYPAGSLIELNSREVAIIIEQNDNQRLLPKVMILRDGNKKPVELFKILDLSAINTSKSLPPRIVNSLPMGSYDIDAEEILQSVNKVDKGWIMRRLFGK